jgi:hypothetical protein
MEESKNSLISRLTIIDDSFDMPPAVTAWLNGLGYVAQMIAFAALVAVVCLAMTLLNDVRDALTALLATPSKIPGFVVNALKIAVLLVTGQLMYFFWVGLPEAVRMIREGFRRDMRL